MICTNSLTLHEHPTKRYFSDILSPLRGAANKGNSIKNPPDSSSRPGKGQCSAAASSGFWLPIPSLSESSGYCRGPCCAGPLLSCHGPYRADKDTVLLSGHLNGRYAFNLLKDVWREMCVCWLVIQDHSAV